MNKLFFCITAISLHITTSNCFTYQTTAKESSSFNSSCLTLNQNPKCQNKYLINEPTKDESPWFTGSLLSLATSPANVGEILVIPKVWNFVTYGQYDNNCKMTPRRSIYSLNPSVSLFTGLAERLDIGFSAQMFQNYYNKKIYTGFGDCSVQFKYLLVKETDELPSFTIGVGEVLPTGSYHNLDPEFEASDGVGNGSYITIMGLRFEKKFHVNEKNWLRFRYDLRYEIPSSVNINGQSVYNTFSGANGTAYPGKVFRSDISCEYHLTKNWVLACDLLYAHTNITNFKGYAGLNKKGILQKGGIPSIDALTLAPAIEYNYSKTVGFIAGVWFSIWGRNSLAFYSPVISAVLSY